METIDVVIADDHKIFVEGLEAMLGQEENIRVLDTSGQMRETMTALQSHRTDVLLTDLNMPGKNGVEMIREIRERFPFVKVVVLTMYYDARLVKELEACEIHGFLLKNTQKDELIDAIQTVFNGGNFRQDKVERLLGDYDFAISMHDEIKDNFYRQYSLGKRELEVLILVALGKKSVEIAENMGISKDTVDTHRKNIKHKVGLNNTAEIAAFAVRNQLI